MGTDIQSIILKFQEQINPVYQTSFRSFIEKAAELNRQKDENVFKSLQSRYMEDFSEKMKVTASELLNENHSVADFEGLRRELTNVISYYLHEFVLKTESAT